MSNRSIHWFRKGLRLHDNPALISSLECSNTLFPVFILDPWFVKNGRVGVNRWRFLLESLSDLDARLRDLGSRLFVLRGKPEEVLATYFQRWNISRLSFEHDIEPYAKERDARIRELASKHNVRVHAAVSHTLYDTREVIKRNKGKPPTTYQKMVSLASEMGPPAAAIDTPTRNHFKQCVTPSKLEEEDDDEYEVPSLDDLGLNSTKLGPRLYPGGESEAIQRMKACLEKKAWIASFEKPKTAPNSLEPSTTVLSPYLKFGCLSPRLFYHGLTEVVRPFKQHSKPPVSLVGQLLWREFFNTVGDGIPNFDRMQGNSLCRQIPWDNDPEKLAAWTEARTGFPFIDAIMTQLRTEGWIHHLARHAVACFLTRGDLWQSWERGMEVFEELLLDADWALNAANWQWLSASAFFHQYFRVYSPIAFGKKTDPNGLYIKKYLPQLKKFPAKYIYEPWTAPKSVQEAAGCLIGADYPRPLVDHDKARQENIAKMAKAYKQGRDEEDSGVPVKKAKR